MGRWAVGLSPEIVYVVEVDSLLERGRRNQSARRGQSADLGALAPPASKAMARRQGLPRNMGGLPSPARSWERRCEESEHRREREKSECRRTSEEVGEPTRGTLRSKGRHREESEPLGGTMEETLSSPTI